MVLEGYAIPVAACPVAKSTAKAGYQLAQHNTRGWEEEPKLCLDVHDKGKTLDA
jgi:hypothetical protein